MNAPESITAGGLTPQQRKAINGRGNLLVVAGAGTGKTRTLVARCLRLVVEEKASLENILMVTFTEAAAAEMRARIRKELFALQGARPEDAHLAGQLALLDTAYICTLHSFCLQLVREQFHELGLDPQFNVLDEQQTRPLTNATLDQLLERHYGGTDAKAKAVRALIRAVGRGDDGRIRKLILKLHSYSQSLPDPVQWLDAQEKRCAQTEPGEWRRWLLTAVAAWRDDWKDFVASVASEAPAAEICARALESLPESPLLADATQALRTVQAANANEEDLRRGTRDSLKTFFAEAEFLGSLIPDEKGNDPLAQDWEWAQPHLSTLVSLAG